MERNDINNINQQGFNQPYQTQSSGDSHYLNMFYNQFQHTRQLYNEYACNKDAIAMADKEANVGHLVIAILFSVLLCFTIIAPVIGIIYIIAWIIGNLANAFTRTAKTNRNEQIKQIIHNEYQKTNKFVHIQYASPYILDKLIQYISTGRCDTMRDCINLYEQEKQTAEQTRLLNNMNNKMNSMAYGIDYIAFSTFIGDIF